MKDTKRKLMPFTFYDRSGIERLLEEEAAKGWLLERTSAAGWIYRRIEPAKIHFAVVYFPSATAFDPAPSDGQQRFQDFCEHTGWELISSNIQLQIFCNRNENPIPIETDPVMELENIHASVKKTFLPSYVMNLLLGFMQLGLTFQRFSNDPVGALANTAEVLSVLFWILLIFSCAAQIFLYYRWYHKATIAAQDGHFLETRNTDRFQITMLFASGLALIFMLLSFGDASILWAALLMIVSIVGCGFLMTKLSNSLKKRNLSANTNRLITYGMAVVISLVICGVVLWLMVSARLSSQDRRDEAIPYEYNNWTYYMYQDDIPLRIEDLMDTTYTGYSREVISQSSSPLLSRYEARQQPRHGALVEPEMHYHIVKVKIPALYDQVMDLMLEDFGHGIYYPEDGSYPETHRTIDPTPWGAQKAYQLYFGDEAKTRYLLCYADHMVEIDLDWEPTKEQMKIIAEKLAP